MNSFHRYGPFTIGFILLLVTLNRSIFGDVVSTSGAIDTSNFGSQGTAGFTSFDVNQVENDFAIQLFEERQGFTLKTILDVDSLGGPNSNSSDAVASTLEAGTVVDSYLLHYDRSSGVDITLSGVVTFETPIIGLVYDNKNNFGVSEHLANSDFLAKQGTIEFYDHIRRGIIFCEDGDSWSIGPEGKTLTIQMTVAHAFTDELRVLVASDSIPLLGDVNQDCFVNFQDVDPLIDRIISSEYQPEADVNQDGFVDLLDVRPFVELITGD